MSSNPTIHIGYHKTGTTFLQQSVFQAHPRLECWDLLREHRAVRGIATAHDFDFDPASYQSLRPRSDLPWVISWEGFVGDPLSGAQTNLRTAERLARVWSGARILITLRSQRTIWTSLYRQYVAEGGTCNVSRFAALDASNRVFMAEPYFRYFELVERYRALFGKERVHVGLYEQLLSTPGTLIAQYLKFIGASPLDVHFETRANPSLKGPALQALRMANHFLRSPLHPGGAVPVENRRARRFLASLSAAAESRSSRETDGFGRGPWSRKVCEGNRRLERDLGLPLASNGYPV
ncbi:MAG: sulfotransferase domain-containing protein [Planctomycetota bacterium]